MKKITRLILMLIVAAGIGCTFMFAACSGGGRTISFDTAGGKEIDPIVVSGEISNIDAEREGYTFDGWYTDADYSGEKVTFPYKPSQSVTLYAKWLPFVFAAENNEYTVTKYSQSDDTEVTVPSEHNGVPVAAVSGGAFSGTNVTKVNLPDGIRKIGADSFANCVSLTGIEVPDKVTEIGNNAFSGCTALASVKLSDNIRTIGDNAFSGCAALTTLTVPEKDIEVGRNAFGGCTALIKTEGGVGYINNFAAVTTDKTVTTVTVRAGTYAVWNYAFENCERLSAVTFADNKIKSIGAYAFSNCKKLVSVTLPAQLTQLNSGAFNGCESLEQITLPATLTKLGGSAFKGCTGLSGITVPAGVTRIKAYTFGGCESLSSVTISGNVDAVEYGAFEGCTSLQGITLPASVEVIGAAAFRDSAISAITLPQSLTAIHSDAFCRTALASVEIPASVKSIGNGAFSCCADLADITFNEGLTDIGYGAFEGCAYSGAIVIPDSVTAIEGNAFADCAGINAVTLGTGTKSVGKNAFRGCAVATVNYNGSIEDWCGISFAESANPVAISHNLYIGGNAVTGLVLADNTGTEGAKTVTSIGAYAFDGLTSLTRVVLHVKVTAIGENAFRGCTAVQDSYYGGSSLQWLGVTVGAGNDAVKNALSYYSENQPASGDTQSYWHYVNDVITKW